MHNFDGERTRFLFNTDLSGDVQIVVRRGQDFDSLHVSGDDLIAFMAHYVRMNMVAAVETMSDREVLNLPEEEMVDEIEGPAEPVKPSSSGPAKHPRAVV